MYFSVWPKSLRPHTTSLFPLQTQGFLTVHVTKITFCPIWVLIRTNFASLGAHLTMHAYLRHYFKPADFCVGRSCLCSRNGSILHPNSDANPKDQQLYSKCHGDYTCLLTLWPWRFANHFRMDGITQHALARLGLSTCGPSRQVEIWARWAMAVNSRLGCCECDERINSIFRITDLRNGIHPRPAHGRKPCEA